MTIADFAGMTQRIIANDGFDGYLPTLARPVIRKIAVLEGVPADVDVEEAAKEWADKSVEPGEEYFLAFKISSTHFRIVHSTGEHREQADFPAEIA